MQASIKNLTLSLIMLWLFTACAPLATPMQPAATSEPAVTSAAAVSDSENWSRYMGLNYPPLPEGVSEQFAMLIQDADHSLSLVSVGESKLLWLGRLTNQDANGNAFWAVKDILDLSSLESGLVLLPDGCTFDGEPDPEIFVVGKDEVIRLAWRANTSLDRFEVIPTQGIECHSDKSVTLE